ncbi:MAG: hypothetical protein AABY85_01075 [Gemmatimonadota bacterium]
MNATLTVLGVGFVLGLRHAFEPDHLAAVSTLAMRQGALRDAARLGLSWGVGHTASVGVVVAAIMLADLRLPPAFQPAADLTVAFLLIILGLSVLLRMSGAGPRPNERDIGGSFGFGVAHGLAGSGAIVVLLVAAAPTRAAQATYFAAFGTGTMLGMLGVSVAVAALARAAARNSGRWATFLHVGSAVASTAAGLLLAANL